MKIFSISMIKFGEMKLGRRILEKNTKGDSRVILYRDVETRC